MRSFIFYSVNSVGLIMVSQWRRHADWLIILLSWDLFFM
jgi:hypothetical protein